MELAGIRPGATVHPRPQPPMSWLPLLQLLLLLPGPADSQLRYSVPEEQAPGAPVGNVARALGLELRRLGPGCLRIHHLGAPSPRYLELDLTNGALFVNERIDREALCEQRPRCLLSLEVLAHSPVAVSAVEVEVLDINDNSPRFPRPDYQLQPRQPNPDWRYSASLRAGMHSSVHLEEAGILRAGPGGPEQQWPTVSSATPEPEAGEVSPPVGAGVNSNSWTFKYGPGNPKQPGPGELPDKFIIPGSPAIISIRQEPTNSQIDKSDFITFGKKEETKKKKKKKKGNKTQEKKEKGNSTTDNSDQ